MEVPVRRILAGARPEKVASRDAMMDPSALDWYVEFAASRTELARGAAAHEATAT